jgi:hypothetical protein
MKKILSLIVVAGFATLVACGPSAEEKAAAEKARQDSINAAMAQQMTADSMQAVQQAAMEKAHADSMANVAAADSMSKAASAKKPAPKPKPKSVQQQKAEDVKKVTSGRGH